MVVACLLFAGALSTSFAERAYAEENSSGENVVNTQQLPDSSFIYDTSIADLNTADAYYDGQTVQVTGEVIGDSIRVGNDDRHRWITLSTVGDSSTISVYMTNESAGKIDTFGSYRATGTILQVRGTFHLVCAEHEGLSDLHAEVVSVVESGVRTEDTFDFNSFIPGIIVVTLGIILTGWFYWLRERRR